MVTNMICQLKRVSRSGARPVLFKFHSQNVQNGFEVRTASVSIIVLFVPYNFISEFHNIFVTAILR